MDYKSFLKLLKSVGVLKRVKRSGWVREGINNPESVAEHNFRIIVMVMVLSPFLDVNMNKLVKMAIIHDLAESETGDLVIERGSNIDVQLRKEREKKEAKVIEELLGKFDKEYVDLFKELIELQTREAKIFRQIDKLEMAIQAAEYEKQEKRELREFFENAKVHVSEPILEEVLLKIISQRDV